MKIGWRNMPLPETLADVAVMLNTSEADLTHVLTRVEGLHYEKTVPTKTGKQRRVLVAKKSLSDHHDQLQVWLNGFWPHKAAHGWRVGHSTMTCVQPHVGQELLLKFDIEDFFPSISHKQVRATLLHFGCGEEAAAVITKLVTARGHLPQGFSTSPALANLISTRVDARVTGICNKLDFRYTRYGDDLTVSGRNVRRSYMVRKVKEIIEDSGFTVNEEKFKEGGIQPATKRQQVLGITINKKRSLPREKREQYERDILDINRAFAAGDMDAVDAALPKVLGRISYAKQVNLRQGLRLEKKLCDELRPEDPLVMIARLMDEASTRATAANS